MFELLKEATAPLLALATFLSLLIGGFFVIVNSFDKGAKATKKEVDEAETRLIDNFKDELSLYKDKFTRVEEELKQIKEANIALRTENETLWKVVREQDENGKQYRLELMRSIGQINEMYVSMGLTGNSIRKV